MATLPPKLVRSTPGALEITERDKLIIHSVYRYRFLTTEQLQVITGTEGRRALNRRLKELFDAKLLDRPVLQHSLYSHSEKRPLIHALGNEGGKLIEQLLDVKLPPSVRWTDKNRKLKKPEYIQHALGIADFFISLEHASKSLPDDVEYHGQDEVISLSPARPGKQFNPLSMPTRYRWWTNGERVERSTVADGIFSLSDDRGDRSRRALFLIEYDGNTMPVVRRSYRQSSIIQKMLGYAAARDAQLHHKQYGYKNFRVLFVTRDNDQRIASMQDAWAKHAAQEIPAGAFLFADFDQLMEKSPLGNVWTNAKGEPVQLVPDILR